MEQNRCLQITHNDADGIMCALLAHFSHNFTEHEVIFTALGDPVHYNIINKLDDLKEGKYDTILFTDLSITEEDMMTLQEIDGLKIIGIDHHKTNSLGETFKEWLVMVNDEENNLIAGCEVMLYHPMFKLSNPDKVVPLDTRLGLLTVMVGRYDVWRWQNNPMNFNEEMMLPYNEYIKEDIIPIISKFIGTEDTYNQLIDFYDKIEEFSNEGILPSGVFNPKFDDKMYKEFRLFPDEFLNIYLSLKANEARSVKYIENKIHVIENGFDTWVYYGFIDLYNYNIAVLINENEHSNFIANHINRNYEDIDLVMILYPQSKKIGLRTSNDIDVSVIAKKFNGGGHAQAAGIPSLNNEAFLAIMEAYYNAPSLSDWVKES